MTVRVIKPNALCITHRSNRTELCIACVRVCAQPGLYNIFSSSVFIHFSLSLASFKSERSHNTLKMEKIEENLANKKRTIIVEGNIGAGKTTFLKHFQRYANAQILLEPLEKWVNLNGTNLLQKMYENVEKWSFPFQSYALLTQLQQHLLAPEKDIKIMERSIYSTRYCFGVALLADDKIERASYDVFVKWFEYAEKCVRDEIGLIVYVRAAPELAYERIQQRNRSEEETVRLEYIQRLHDLHEAWLFQGNNNTESSMSITSSGIPVFILNANLPACAIHTEYERFKLFLQKSPQFNVHLKEN